MASHPSSFVLFAVVVLLVAGAGSAASGLHVGAPGVQASHGQRDLAYVLGGAELGRKCPALDSNVGGICVTLPDSNVFGMDVSIADDTGLPVAGYLQYVSGGFVSSGMFCGHVHVDSNWANPPSIMVLPSMLGIVNRCGGVATAGSIVLQW